MACKIFREAVHRVHEVGVTNISRSVHRGSWVIFPLAVNSWQEEPHGGHSFCGKLYTLRRRQWVLESGKMASAAHQAFVSRMFEALSYVCVLSNTT